MWDFSRNWATGSARPSTNPGGRGTLYKREYGAYLLSQVLGWNFIPLTIVRDGPYGIGSVQQYVDHDPRLNYYTLSDADAEELRMIACFDMVANNTDRKANHVLVDGDGKLWGIDQGLTFHSDTKIRTVIWDFGGEPIPKPLSGLADQAGPSTAPPVRATQGTAGTCCSRKRRKPSTSELNGS